MNANLMMKTIEMTTNEAKQAGKIGSDKFKELRAYQEAYTDPAPARFAAW